MEKLIELLNKYEKEKIINEGGSVDEDDNYFGRSIENGKIVNRNYDPDAHSFMDEYIISKRYLFIKWLVENDKIDIEKVCKSEQELNVNISVWRWPESNYYWLLMILAIQDEPIEFLISILK